MSRNGICPADSVRIASPLAQYSGRAGCLLGGDGCIGCWLKGHGVAQDLNVDPAGLLTAAASSEEVAATLGATASAAGAGGGQATHAAVSALDAAIAAARGFQSGRVAQQAADMQSASSNYQGTDERAADNLAETM